MSPVTATSTQRAVLKSRSEIQHIKDRFPNRALTCMACPATKIKRSMSLQEEQVLYSLAAPTYNG